MICFYNQPTIDRNTDYGGSASRNLVYFDALARLKLVVDVGAVN